MKQCFAEKVIGTEAHLRAAGFTACMPKLVAALNVPSGYLANIPVKWFAQI